MLPTIRHLCTKVHDALLLLALAGLAPIATGDDLFDPRLPPGHSPLRYYPLEEYRGTPQVWTSAQDSKGFLYFLDTGSNFLQYDGARWRQSSMPFFFRQLLIDDGDRIFVAGNNEFGYLLQEADGPRFVSLVELLPEAQRDYIGVRVILEFDDGIVFGTQNYLYLLRGTDDMQVLVEDETASFREAFVWQNTLYVESAEAGLLRWTGHRLVPVAGQDALIKPLRFQTLVPYDASSALLFSRTAGTFRLRNDTLEPFPLPSETELMEREVNYGLRTSEGHFLLTTSRGGALLLDRKGKVLERFDEDRREFLNNSAYHALEDAQGNLWLSTDSGIVQIPRLPVRIMVEPSEVQGSLHRAHRHKGRLYVATRANLYREALPKSPDGALILEKVDGIDAGTWFLMTAEETLLVATARGIFALEDSKSEQSEQNEKRLDPFCPPLTVDLLRSRLFPDRIFAGTRDGLRTVYRRGDDWVCSDPIEGVEGLVYELVEGNDEEMLLRTSEGKLYQLTFPGGIEEPPTVKSHALPKGNNEFFKVDGTIYFSNPVDGVFRYLGSDTEVFPFTPDDTFSNLRSADVENQQIIHFDEANGRLWLQTNSIVEVAERTEVGAPFERRRLAADLVEFWCDIYRDPELDLYWLTNVNGVHLLDPAFERRTNRPRVHLRSVHTLSGQSELLTANTTSAGPPSLPFEENALRFEFASPDYDQLGDNDYQVQLEGFEDEWSRFTAETTKDYTYLREGDYRFRIRARDRWNTLSDVTSFSFTIRPPFYRTPWAYFAYFLALCALAALTYRLHQRKLAHERAINQQLREYSRLKEQEVATLQGLLSICARCKKIRDEEGQWTDLEIYIQDRSKAQFSHGVCMDCAQELYPSLTGS